MFIYTGFADEISPDLAVQIEEFKRLGIGYIEARGINGRNIASYSPDEAREIKKILDENGIKLSALGSPIGKIKITEDFAPELERFKNILELAKVFETKYIRMFSFFIDDNADAADYRDEVLARWRRYIDAAKGYGVILLHENEKGIYGNTWERCLDLHEILNCEYVKATFDPANFVQCGVDVMKAFEMLEKYIKYIHIKDAIYATGEVVLSGMGDGCIRELVARLKAANYNGFVSIEPHLGDFVGYSALQHDDETKEASDVKKFTLAFKALKDIVG